MVIVAGGYDQGIFRAVPYLMYFLRSTFIIVVTIGYQNS